MTKAMHMFLTEQVMYADRSHISVIADPVTRSMTITLETTEDDLKDLNTLLGEVRVEDTATDCAWFSYVNSPAYKALEQRGE